MKEIELFILIYFYLINAVYLFLIGSTIIGLINKQKMIKAEYMDDLLQAEDLPSISFLIPSYNESDSITFTIQTLLNLSYRYKKIIVINDGSTDSTLIRLKKAFNLAQIHPCYEESIKTKPVKGFYQSLDHAELIVVDKLNGGRSDAVNAGVNACDTDYAITLDADTLIEKKELNEMIRYFLAQEDVQAAGASVRVANGCKIHLRGITEIGAPDNYLAGIQAIEYLRAFIIGRFGWEPLGGALVISGAFSFFETDMLREYGGFDTKTVGEDMEITVRYKYLRGLKKKSLYTPFIPEPVAWTEVPEDLSTLSGQRTRWSLGLAQVLWKYKKMFFNPRYGFTGLIIYPYFVFGEMLQPIVEVTAYAIILYKWMLGLGTSNFLIDFILVSWGFTTLINSSCLFIEQISFQKYNSKKDIFKFILYGFLENLGYRQLNLYWRLKGLLKALFKRDKWAVVKKGGFKKISSSGT